MFLAPMTIKEIFHGNCEKTGCYKSSTSKENNHC